MSPLPSGAWLALGWLGVGLVVGALLHRRGHPRDTCLAAVWSWPFLLPLLYEVPPTGPRPMGERIARTLDAVTQTLREHEAGDDLGALADLRAAMLAAEARIAWVDRVIAEHRALSRHDTSPALDALVRARTHARDELERVLDEVLQLRLQVGLHALHGPSTPIRRTLTTLRARVATLAELSDLSRATPAPDADAPVAMVGT